MVKKTKDVISGFPTWLKYTASVISLISALAGGLYAMDDRYVSDKEAAQSLQSFDMKIQQDLTKIELQILQTELENANDTYYKHKQLIRTYPTDQELKDDLMIIKEKREKIKKEIDEKVHRNEIH